MARSKASNDAANSGSIFHNRTHQKTDLPITNDAASANGVAFLSWSE